MNSQKNYTLTSFLASFLLLLSVGCSGQFNQNQEASSLINWESSKKSLMPNNTDKQQEILASLNREVDKLQACDGEIDSSVSQQMSSVYPLTQKQYLVEFLCFLGAYQGNYQYFLYDKSSKKAKITPLSLVVFETNKKGKHIKTDVKSVGGIPDYDEEKKILTVLTKYRGLGDCGSLGKYHWENNKLKLIEYRIKAQCDGKYIEPEQYSQVYPEQVIK